ncbi:DoxX family protein [Flavobacterium sp. IMCC34852]|uniref:DoxX family protein n=1 Tax=Flavobacterium rivulicola TaxID=2732161 RepID=A0A7Y3R9R0_9FLAO|nr:DoxX family protein [Flavobacterium sp. IMCC34852]NNT71962.1 DoxX family protein [Flavobacterium sp. IMCC34852]
MKLFSPLTKPFLLPHWSQDIVLAIPRIVCGFLLTSSFGADKFGLPWSPADKNLGLFEVAYWFPNDVAEYGGLFALAPTFFAWMGAFSEAIGGIFLLLGFQTRIASFLIICTMLVAIFMQQIQNGLWNCLAAMGFLWVGIFYMTLGSGRFGVDYLITKKLKERS